MLDVKSDIMSNFEMSQIVWMKSQNYEKIYQNIQIQSHVNVKIISKSYSLQIKSQNPVIKH